MNKNWFQTILTATILFGITTVLYLYTSGYRLDRSQDDKINLEKTGMIGAKSVPEGAAIYVNDKLMSATNDTIAGLNPGVYTLKIIKNGFVPWMKDVEILPELVTDVTAVLVSQSARLEPLTNTGAKAPSMPTSLSKIAFFSKDPESPGVWVMPFIDTGISFFKSNAVNVLEDTFYKKYSDGVSIEWSPDEKNLLIQTMSEPTSEFYVVDLDTNTAQTTESPELMRQTWAQELMEKRADFLQKIDIPEDMREIATSDKAFWSPDNKKFLYKIEKDSKIEYKVYNMEKPIPVGEKKDNLVFTTSALDPQPQISWYADSFHLILTEGYDAEKNTGAIHIIRIDGTNKTEIYKSTLMSDKVFSAPSGDKLIILTKFKSMDQSDLYTVGIR